jgi:hypothetical protein
LVKAHKTMKEGYGMAVEPVEYTEMVEEVLLRRDVAEAVRTLGPRQTGYLVSLYYATQKDRIRLGNIIYAKNKREEPHMLVNYFFERFHRMEKEVYSVLKQYVQHLIESGREDARWLLSVRGIGPVLAAGLLSELDINNAKSASSFWKYAGLDPTIKWGKGQKRPFNLRLKVLCWKIAQSFKRQPPDKSYYARLYRMRKDLEQERNARGDFAEVAKQVLEKHPDHAQKEFYEQGLLPPGRIDLRAGRWAVKIFLAHLYHVMHEHHKGVKPPRPYVIEHLGHTDYWEPPNWPVVPGVSV